MSQTQVVIVGGGIAGLYAARQLQELNISFQLFDAKPLFGGRVTGVPCVTSNTKFHDMGPSWVYPHHFLSLQLVDKLEIDLFDQHTHGDVLYQFENIREPKRLSNPPDEILKRIDGGAYALIRALVRSVSAQSLNAAHQVSAISKVDKFWRVESQHKGQKKRIICSHVILALPPRIIARDFAKAGWMGKGLYSDLIKSQTWMASQAKFLVTYNVPFWRENGLSGQAFSQVGPLVEINDACISDTEGFALSGVIGMAATQRLALPQNELKRSCIRQLANIFGHSAYRFDKCYIKDWANDKFICTGQDQSEGSRDPSFDISKYEEALAENNMYLAASEFAKIEPGYIEGAISAVDAALANLNT